MGIQREISRFEIVCRTKDFTTQHHAFRSIRTFNTVYKTHMNMTPSEYVRKKK